MKYKNDIRSEHLKKFSAIFVDRKWKSRIDEQTKILLTQEIKKFYFDIGMGLKLVSRDVLGCSYSTCRSLFEYLGLEFRTGNNVSTKYTNTVRKSKAEFENKFGFGFNGADVTRFDNDSTRGIQGYYYNEPRQKYVWLRSSWEFIYAKFLNRIGEDWDVEVQRYILSDGTHYKPDFFIYKNGELKKIVEIKGYFDNRAYKAQLLKDEYYKETDVEIVIVSDIKRYIDKNSNKDKELAIWKTIKKSKDFISSLSQ